MSRTAKGVTIRVADRDAHDALHPGRPGRGGSDVSAMPSTQKPGQKPTQKSAQKSAQKPGQKSGMFSALWPTDLIALSRRFCRRSRSARSGDTSRAAAFTA